MSPPMISTVLRLVDAIPDLRDAYEEHVSDNDEVLPHVFFGDVARYLRQACLEYRSSRAAPPSSWQAAEDILRFMEREWVAGPEVVRELIHVSLLENLVTGEDECDELESFLGPELRAALKVIHKAWGRG